MRRPARDFLRQATAIAAAAVLATTDAAIAQISVDATMLTSGYSQNFDGMGTSGTASLPTGWKFTVAGAGTSAGWSTAANVTATTQGASSGSPTAGGIYNWGSTTTDRSPGFMTSGSYASPNGLLFGLTNSTTSTITGLTLAFDYERYRINTAAASVTFFGSTDGSTWTAVTAGDSGAFATGTSAYTFTSGTVVNKTGISISSLNIGQNQSYYLKWNFNTTGSSSQGIGLDNFTTAFTTSGGGGGPNYYWVGADTTLGGAGTWTQTAGTAWRPTDTNGAGEAWDSSKIATFGGASSGTVTVTDTVNANAGLSFATSGYTLTGGTVSLGGANAAANTITTNASTAIVIDSVLAGSTGLTKAGSGTLTLSGTNTFTGEVTISGGVLSVASQANLGAASVVNINGGTLSITGAYSTSSGAAQAFTVGASGGTLEVAAGVTASKLGNQLLGPGNTLTKTGAGTLSLSSSGTSTLGTLNVNAGSFRITSGRIGSVGAINVGSGGTFWIDDTSSITSLSMATGATLSFAGDGQDGSGAYRHSLDEAGNAATTIAQAVSLPSTARFTMVNRGADTVTDTFSGVISGSGGLIKDGTGTMILSATNTFTGDVTISSGVLSVGAPANLGAASAVNIDGGTLRITDAYSTTGSATQAFTIGASGGTLEVAAGVTASKRGDQLLGPGNTLTKTGGGTLGLTTSGTSTLGTLNLNAGSLRLTSNRIGSVGVINVASGGTFWIDDTSSITTLTMATGATLSFAGDGQDAGGAFRHTIAPAEAGNAVVTIPQAISLPSTARFTLVNDAGVGKTVTDTFSGVVSGLGGLIKDGTGTMVLSGANTYSGGTTVSAGTLSVAADAALGDSAGGITLGGGRLELTSGFTLGSGRTITAATGTSSTIAVTSGTVSFAGPFTGSGNLDKAGAGMLSLGNASSGYSGTFTISAGTLEITAADAFAGATLTQTGGTLLLAPTGGGDVVIPEIGGSGGEVSVDAGASAVFRGNSNRAYDGRIRGQGAFKKEGNGILTLNADNDFTGNTRITQGRLKLGAGGGLSATPQIDIDSGAIFDVADRTGFALGTGQRLGGRGTVLGDLQFGGGSQLAFDPTGPILIGSGTVSFTAGFGIGSIFGLNSNVAEGTYTLLNETTGGNISVTNLANVGPGSAFDLGGGKSAYFQQGSLQVVVVPEPEALLTGALGLAIAGFAAARRPVTRRAAPGG